MKKIILASAVLVAFIGLVLFPSSTTVVDQPIVGIEEQCIGLHCEVDRRTQLIFERDKNEYMEQSRLKALQEMNREMMDMTQDPEQRLNK